MTQIQLLGWMFAVSVASATASWFLYWLLFGARKVRTEEALRLLTAGKIEDWNELRQRNLVGRKVLRKTSLSALDLQGINLSNLDLADVDFEGADLQYADITSSVLTNANFTNAILDSAKLDSSDLKSARFKGTSLRGVSYRRSINVPDELSRTSVAETPLLATGPPATQEGPAKEDQGLFADPQTLEQVVRDLFKSSGFSISDSPRTSSFDFTATITDRLVGERVYVVECRFVRYTSSVASALVHRLYLVKLETRADKAIIVTNGSFTRQAREIAASYRDIHLMDGEALGQLIEAKPGDGKAKERR